MRCILQLTSIALLLTPYTISSPIPQAATLQAALSESGIAALNEKNNGTNSNIPTGSLRKPSKREPDAAPEPIADPDPEPEPDPRSATIVEAEDNSGVTDTTNRLHNSTGIPEGSLADSSGHVQEITRRDTISVEQATEAAGINELTANKTTTAGTSTSTSDGLREIGSTSKPKQTIS